MTPQPYILHALSPLHCGVGQAAGLIDLPIARLKGTGIPFVPGSSIKGVLRDACTGQPAATPEKKEELKKEVEAVFGPDFENAGKHAGALTCTDARLLALPVRSFRGTFAYVTSPLLLTLAARDLTSPPPIPAIGTNEIIAADFLRDGAKVYLEDLDLAVPTKNNPPTPEQVKATAAYEGWSNLIAAVFGRDPEAQKIFRNRFAIVDDETMTFLWDTATQLDHRVRISPDTRTVAKGALWLEESLPPETLMIGLLMAETSRDAARSMAPDQVLKAAMKAGTGLQFGGKSTVGRGRCRMVMLGAAP